MVTLEDLDDDDVRKLWVGEVWDALIARDVKRRAFLVSRAMARYMNPTLRCRPGVSHLAEDTGLSERTVAYALAELRRARLLRKLVKGHTGKATLYRGRRRADEAGEV
jgi:DNA-binding transcriptional ArsR family regulator